MPEAAARLRIRFSKLGRVRFTSQRDVARMWERALRRSGLRVAWSEGFSPRPLLSFGLALPTGCESTAEYIDIRLEGPPVGTDGLGPLLSSLLPEGVVVTAAAPLEHGVGSLQHEVISCSWTLEVLGVTELQLGERVGSVLEAPSLPVRRERKGRMVEDDLRPSILSLAVTGPGTRGERASTPVQLDAVLATRPRGVRPAELLQGLGSDLELVRACRTHQWIEREGARLEPLPPGDGAAGASAPHAQERAT